MTRKDPVQTGLTIPTYARVRVLRLAALTVTVTIAWLTLISSAPSLPSMRFEHADKLGHAVAFFGWAALVAAGWQRSVWTLLAVAALFGGAIELIQPLAGRTAELADLGADLSGAVLGVWSVRWLLPRSTTRWQTRSAN